MAVAVTSGRAVQRKDKREADVGHGSASFRHFASELGPVRRLNLEVTSRAGAPPFNRQLT